MAGATVAEALRAGMAALSGLDGGARDARVLLAHVMGVDGASLLRDRDAVLDPAAARAFDAALGRRLSREPVALILGRAGFWTLDLEVSGAALVPRADSETLIEAALAARPGRDGVRRILDLGTGTGCLLLAALAEFPNAYGVGVDLAPDAAALARRNAVRNGLAARAGVMAGCWADAVAGTFDLVLSNPPYVAGAEMAGLMPEVRDHEPWRALYGGTDGLDAFRVLLRLLPRVLAPGGLAVFEVGMGQAGAVEAMAHAAGFSTRQRPDLAGVARAVLLER